VVDSSAERDRRREGFLPRGVVVAAAFVSAVVLIIVALLGPLGLGVIRYWTSASGVAQTMGVDFVNLVLIAPILLIGGAMLLARKDAAKYFLVLTPITLFSLAIEAGVGQEWGNPAYPGNAERYAGLFILLIAGSLILLLGSLPLFTPEDVPRFGRRGLRVYVGVMCLLLAVFTVMWISELAEVTTTGDTATGSYSATPVGFWAVRFMDLGVTIPLGFVGLFLLITRPERAYPIVLLFFGFFVTLGTSVCAMAVMMVLRSDPTVQAGGLVIFPALAILAWAGLLYLVKDKLPWARRTQLQSESVSP